MKNNFIHIDKIHTWQSYKDNIYLGCSVYDEALGNFIDVTLKIPAQVYLQDIAGDFKETVRETYKRYIDEL